MNSTHAKREGCLCAAALQSTRFVARELPSSTTSHNNEYDRVRTCRITPMNDHIRDAEKTRHVLNDTGVLYTSLLPNGSPTQKNAPGH